MCQVLGSLPPFPHAVFFLPLDPFAHCFHAYIALLSSFGADALWPGLVSPSSRTDGKHSVCIREDKHTLSSWRPEASLFNLILSREQLILVFQSQQWSSAGTGHFFLSLWVLGLLDLLLRTGNRAVYFISSKPRQLSEVLASRILSDSLKQASKRIQR